MLRHQKAWEFGGESKKVFEGSKKGDIKQVCVECYIMNNYISQKVAPSGVQENQPLKLNIKTN